MCYVLLNQQTSVSDGVITIHHSDGSVLKEHLCFSTTWLHRCCYKEFCMWRPTERLPSVAGPLLAQAVTFQDMTLDHKFALTETFTIRVIRCTSSSGECLPFVLSHVHTVVVRLVTYKWTEQEGLVHKAHLALPQLTRVHHMLSLPFTDFQSSFLYQE